MFWNIEPLYKHINHVYKLIMKLKAHRILPILLKKNRVSDIFELNYNGNTRQANRVCYFKPDFIE